MTKLEFFYHILISISIHIVIFLFIFYTKSSDISQPTLKVGGVVTTNLVFLKNPTRNASSPTSSKLINQQEEGTETEEISKFQNSLSYPPLALERGWETECEWEVEIIEGKIVTWNYLRACSHEIFRTTVEKSFRTWEFSPRLTKKIKIPIRFKIQQQN